MISRVRIIMAVSCAAIAAAFAGELNPTTGPGEPGSQSYTPQDIYNRLDTGAAGTKAAAFAEPTTGPTAGGVTMDDIMAKTPAPNDANGAVPAQALTGKLYWGLTSTGWGLKTGTMPVNGAVTITPSTVNQTIPAGYHNGSDIVQGDANLVSSNIKSGVILYNVTGTYCNGGARFKDNGNGTVTDNATKLIWTKNANPYNQRMTWSDAFIYCNNLDNGRGGLSDRSKVGDWRLPNINELASLIDYRFYSPALSNAAGTGEWGVADPFRYVELDNYWSSSAGDNYNYTTVDALNVNLSSGVVNRNVKTSTLFVWPVRGGQ